jgi:hypothetical protein
MIWGFSMKLELVKQRERVNPIRRKRVTLELPPHGRDEDAIRKFVNEFLVPLLVNEFLESEMARRSVDEEG